MTCNSVPGACFEAPQHSLAISSHFLNLEGCLVLAPYNGLIKDQSKMTGNAAMCPTYKIFLRGTRVFYRCCSSDTSLVGRLVEGPLVNIYLGRFCREDTLSRKRPTIPINLQRNW